jgi:hypothetical protein
MNTNPNSNQTTSPTFNPVKKVKTSRGQTELVRLAERGFAVHQQVLVLNEELKQIKDRLKSEAEARPNEHIPLDEKESEGSQWVVTGNGCECRIVFPDARLKSEFDPTKSEFKTLRSLAGEEFDSLFNSVILYRVADKKTFREKVHHLLDSSAAKELLDLATTPSEPKAIWKARPVSVNS